MLNRLRGAIRIAFIWELAWAVVGVFIAPLLLALNGGTTAGVPLLEAPIWARAVIFGIVGFANGLGFSLVLALGERHRTFRELSLARIIAWGLVGGASYPALHQVATRLMPGLKLPGGGIAAMVICAVLSALSAWAMLAIARRAKDAGPSQLGAGAAPDVRTRPQREAPAPAVPTDSTNRHI